MKRLLFFFLFLLPFISCKKGHTNGQLPTEGSQMVSGVLFWLDPAVDGPGLYYQTEKEEQLILKEDTLNMYALHLKYKNLVGIPSRLTYSDTGDSSCLSQMIPGPCLHKIRVVEVLKLEK
jgi:hypothetical protein